MKLVLFIEENLFLHPEFLNYFCKKKVKIFLVIIKKNKLKSKINFFIFYYLLKYDFLTLLKLAFIILKKKLRQILFNIKLSKSPITVVDFARYNNIQFFYYSKIKKEKIINRIKKFKPDYIINSSPIYFDKKLLKLPKYFCINRHSSILPSYGGVLPVFHMIKDKHKYYGVSLIKMSPKIDGGKVISQSKFFDKSKNMFQIYTRTFKHSELLLNKFLFQKKKTIVINKKKKSYFGVPNNNDQKKFYYEKGKII